MTDKENTKVPKLMTPASLVTEVQPFLQNANDLLEQAERAEIVDQESFTNATDFIKICNSQLNVLKDNEQSLTKPLTAHVTWIRAQYAPVRDVIEDAKSKMSEKGTDWHQAEQKRLQEEAAEAERLAEEEALKEAEQAQAAGDEEKADAIIDTAASTPSAPARVATARGSITGASGSVSKRWDGEVDDIKAICAAIAKGDLPIDTVTAGKAKLNAFAKTHGKEGVVHGIKITHKAGMSVR